ncbi:uncharacterized protein K02A2.6-like [Drosophila eugracilis]|uniref:uncharacterized protein K02A2.6-like n=1 Tax=Drosophila eugracilis TaxID=29029 RepID=UPI001BDAA549|nr:uncharacterized protein K02A2.6-like [Drosophila eugracilis]
MEIEEICLKDKILDSWAPPELKKKLLSKEHSLDEIVEACQAEEQINKQSEAMQKPTVEAINKIEARKAKLEPVQQPVRRIPVALEDKVAVKLDEGLKRDIIESLTSLIVLAFKENGDIRLCVDMRLANKAIRRENYPLPTFESFMTKLRGARFFSRLDLKDAYHQQELDEDSREITTFITPMGLFRYKRLMFGVNSAPEIFQSHLEQLLVDFPNVMNYIEDVIIFGESQEEHDKTVRDVRKVFEENNVLLNDQKCV